jgi:hypothetical protein
MGWRPVEIKRLLTEERKVFRISSSMDSRVEKGSVESWESGGSDGKVGEAEVDVDVDGEEMGDEGLAAQEEMLASL